MLVLILVLAAAASVLISLAQLNFLKKMPSRPSELLSPAELAEAVRLGVKNERFKIFSTLYSLALNLLWLSLGLAWLREWLIVDNSLFENTLLLLAFILLSQLAALPLGIYEAFVKDRAFTTLTPATFIADTAKALLLTALITGLLGYGLLFCLDLFGSWWWLAGLGLALAFVLLANLLYPTLIAPLFNKMSPLDDPALAGEISAMMGRCGFAARGIFVMDASRRDKRLNAYFGGLGRAKRVVLFDTLLAAMSRAELLAVLAHELGHFVHKDLLKGLAATAGVLFVAFFALAHLPASFYADSGLEGARAGVLILFCLLVPVLFFVLSPLLYALSRKNEFAADAHGAALAGTEAMRGALATLARENKACPEASPIYTFFCLSHPPIAARLAALKNED